MKRNNFYYQDLDTFLKKIEINSIDHFFSISSGDCGPSGYQQPRVQPAAWFPSLPAWFAQPPPAPPGGFLQPPPAPPGGFLPPPPPPPPAPRE